MTLEVRDLHAYYGQSHILHGVAMDVGDNEIVSLLGRNGVGRSTACKSIMGLVTATGSIRFKGRDVAGLRPDQVAHCGIGYVPEDRHARGFVPTLGVAENLTLSILERLSQWGIVSNVRRRDAAETMVKRLQIVASSGEQPLSELSGGNQQKVVVGRALAAQPSLLVVVSPTVGVDVASKEALLGVIDRARQDGTAVLLVSDDLDELRICTRVLVVRRGAIVNEFRNAPWDRHELIAAAEGLEAA
jgi:simple sugar transport system ATP-binding protein